MYKRQNINFAGPAFRFFCDVVVKRFCSTGVAEAHGLKIGLNNVPVSYTHLDVYKRHGVGFLHDMGSRILGLDVADLTVNALLCRRDSAIAIDVHASPFLSLIHI